MNHSSLPYRIFPLGDAALTIDFGNCIDEQVNKEVIARFRQLQQEPLPGMIEAIPAYSSLTVYYDIFSLAKRSAAQLSVYEWMKQHLEEKMKQPVLHAEANERLVKIPVCYDEAFAPDINNMASAKKITKEEIIQLHASKTYKVFMLGFLPGFPYMGEVDEKLVMPRKPQPMNVQAGSVGIAGKQTGIYPLTSPGGWQIIGRTPLKLFDTSKEEPVFLQAGDRVKFFPVTMDEYNEILNSPLVGGEP